MSGEIVPYRPTTADDRDALVKPITAGLQDLVFGSPGLFEDRPGFIAAPPGANPFVNAVRDISQFNCRRWASTDKSTLSTRVNTGNAELCRPYLEGIGEWPTEGDVGPPWEGGQCPGVNYDAFWEQRWPDGTGGYTWRERSLVGVIMIGPMTITPSADIAGCGTGTTYENETVVPTEGNAFLVGTGGCSDQSPSYRNLRFVPKDGSTCENPDPPPQIRPPATIVPVNPIPPEITVNVPGFGPVNVNVNLDPEGDPIVCFEEIQTCVTVKPPSTDPGGGGSGGGAPPLDPAIGDPIDGPVAGSGGGGSDTGFGAPPPGRIWIGAFVEITNDMTALGIVPGSSPENAALTKVAGNASLIIDSGLVARVRSRATQIRSEWSEHLVTYPGLTVNGIRVNMNPALTYRVHPVSVADPSLEQSE